MGKFDLLGVVVYGKRDTAVDRLQSHSPIPCRIIIKILHMKFKCHQRYSISIRYSRCGSTQTTQSGVDNTV